MTVYWVIGGVYTDTRFDRVAGGDREQRHGPFATHEDAKAEWARRAWASVDDAHARWRIEEEGPEEAIRFFVVGGEYRDTSFAEPAPGQVEQVIGPFSTNDEAKTEWARRAWASVDDAHTRWRIEKRRAPSLRP